MVNTEVYFSLHVQSLFYILKSNKQQKVAIMSKLRKLTDEDLNKISEIAVLSAQDFIFAEVSKKEINDIDINVKLDYDEGLDVNIIVDIVFDDLSSVDTKIADEAADHALLEIEKFLNI